MLKQQQNPSIDKHVDDNEATKPRQDDVLLISPGNANNDGQILHRLVQLISGMAAQMGRIEQRIDSALPQSKLPEDMIGTKAAMNLLGYKDTHSFLAAARKRRVYYVRVNARKFCWSPAAIETWKRERGIGRLVQLL